jgi:NAD(P)-dependent dehydrogenase (short-subunit alcohol dehydrogenase family)
VTSGQSIGTSIRKRCPRSSLSEPLLDDPNTLAWITGRILRGAVGERWELVGPALFLASDASSFVTGTSLLVDDRGASSGASLD